MDQVREPRAAGQGEQAADRGRGLFRLLGGSIVTGAADDDPSAIGTWAPRSRSASARSAAR